MQTRWTWANVCIDLKSEDALTPSESLTPFLTPYAAPDVTVSVSRRWADCPQPPAAACGRDLLAEYYRDGDRCWMMTRGGPKGYVAAAVYTEPLTDIAVYLNDAPFLYPITALDSVLRFLPVRELLLQRGVLFLHASQVALQNGRSILFTAPSGTGKTTQARLWNACRGARITSNDRVLLWRTPEGYAASGYPIDGSSPVGCAERQHPACVVCLEQADGNTIGRLEPTARSLALLFPQLVIDTWSAQSRLLAMEQLLTLFETLPVYRLACTPDERAVECLEREMTAYGKE